jgi:hypothetical protein
MVKKTAALVDMYHYQRQTGHDDELADELREAAEEEIRREDNRHFRYGDPAGEQLGKPVGRMLREKPFNRFDESRDGSRGTH